MKSNQLKELLRHIILEVNSQFVENSDYDNFDDPSNVANAIYSGLYKAPDNAGTDPSDGGQVWSFTLHSNSGPRHMIKRTPDGEWFYSDSGGNGRKWKYAGNYIAAKKKDREEYKRTGQLANEMIANKDAIPEPMAAVNLEENELAYKVLLQAKEIAGLHFGEKNVANVELNDHNANRDITTFRVTFKNHDVRYILRDRRGEWYEKVVSADVFAGRDQLHKINLNPSQKSRPDLAPQKIPAARGGTGMHQAKDWNPDAGPKLTMKEGLFSNDVEEKAEELFGKVKRITKVSHPDSNSEYFRITLEDPDSHHTIRKAKDGKLSLGKEVNGKLSFDQVEEDTGTGAVAGYATPFAFKPTGGAGERRRKKKHIKEDSRFLDKVKSKMAGTLDIVKSLKNEKTNPDGTYADDMEDHRRSNRIAGMNEAFGQIYFEGVPYGSYFSLPEYRNLVFQKIDRRTAKTFEVGRKMSKINSTTKTKKVVMPPDTLVTLIGDKLREDTGSGAVGQPGGLPQVAAWGTKNALGSPKGIKGSEKLGYKVVRSITNESK